MWKRVISAHYRGNILDFVITDVSVESLMKHHHAITCDLVSTKSRPLRNTIAYRKYTAIDKSMFVCHPRVSPLVVHREIYTKSRDAFKQCIASTKSPYYCAEIEASSQDTKEMYRITNNLKGRTRTSVLPEYDDDPDALIGRLVACVMHKIADIGIQPMTSTQCQLPAFVHNI